MKKITEVILRWQIISVMQSWIKRHRQETRAWLVGSWCLMGHASTGDVDEGAFSGSIAVLIKVH